MELCENAYPISLRTYYEVVKQDYEPFLGSKNLQKLYVTFAPFVGGIYLGGKGFNYNHVD